MILVCFVAKHLDLRAVKPESLTQKHIPRARSADCVGTNLACLAYARVGATTFL